MWMRLGVALTVILLPGVMLAPVWRLHGLGAGEDDVLYYYPMRVLLHETAQAGAPPWFNPWTGLGRPYMADPQTAVWYPPTWLFAVLPPLWAYPAALWLHYSLALWGMYRLLRAQDLDRLAALTGAIAFAFSGFMLAHRAHVAMQHAAAWAPWVLWRLQRYVFSPPGDTRHTWRLLLATIVFALQCLSGHVQIAALTMTGALVWLLALRRGQRVDPSSQGAPRGPSLATTFGGWLVVGVCAAGLFAVQWVPTWLYVRECTRTQRGYLDFVENSWVPVSIVGWTMPMLLGQRTPNFFDVPYWGPSHQCEQFAYPGLATLLLAAVALRPGWRTDPRRRAWIVLGVAAALLALGMFGPICPWLYFLPGASLFRCPARALLLVNLSLAALAAGTLHDLGAALTPARARLRAALRGVVRRPLFLLLLLIGIPLIAAVATLPWLSEATRQRGWAAVTPWHTTVWVPVVMLLLTAALLKVVVRRWQQPAWRGVLPLCLLLDLGLCAWTIDVPAHARGAADLLTPRAPTEWIDAVRESGQTLWVVATRQGTAPGEYVNPIDNATANTNILRGVAALADYGPLQPRNFVQRFVFKPWGEALEPVRLLSDTAWTRACNVGWVLCVGATLPPPTAGSLVTTTATGGRLYRLPQADGLAVVEPADYPAAVQAEMPAPHRLRVTANLGPPNTQPATSASPRLVVSRLALPGWSASVAGQPLPLTAQDDLLWSVPLPASGTVTIDWQYDPPGWRWGLALASATGVLLLLGGVWSFVVGKRPH